MKWFKSIWSKFILEVITTLAMWLLYFIVRHLLPKNWRLNDSQIKKILKDFGEIATNIVSSESSIGEVLEKSKNIFHYFFEERNGERDIDEEFELFIRDLEEETEVILDKEFTRTILPRILDYADIKTIVNLTQPGTVIAMATLSIDGQTVNIYHGRILMEGSAEGYSVYGRKFAITKGFNYHLLTNHFFEIFDNRLYFSINKYTDKVTVGKLEHLNIQENYITPTELYNDLLTEIKAFKKRGIQRSYILLGEPGTGKTTFCLEISKQVSGRILKLDSKLFTDLSNLQTRTIIENMICDFIIVDDIDRLSSNDRSEFLYLIETMKSYKLAPTLLCTVNDITKLDKALLRPGRFDRIIEFNLPNTKERKFLIEKILQKLETPILEIELDMLAEATDGMSQAYLKEYCEQFKNEPDINKIIKMIKQRAKYIEKIAPTGYDDTCDEADLLDELSRDVPTPTKD